MERGGIRALQILFGLWATASLGCGHDTSTAPRPTVVPEYSSPTLTLQTLAKGIADKSATNGSDVYQGAFAESALTGDGHAFHAFFDPRDLLRHPAWDPNRDWNKDLERVMYTDLVRKYAYPYEMTWEPYEAAGNETGTTVDSLLHRKYRIVQALFNGSTITRIPIATGAADLYFVRSSGTPGKWVIALWQDYHTFDADSAQITLGERRLDTQ